MLPFTKVNSKFLASSVQRCLKNRDPFGLFHNLCRKISNQTNERSAPPEGVNSEESQVPKEEGGVFSRILKGKKDSLNEDTTKIDLKQILQENKSLQESIKDLKDRYARALAETENTRQRMTKEVEKVKVYAIQGFCKDLLEVADILAKACESVPPELLKQIQEEQATNDNDNLLKTQFISLNEGLKMTSQQLQKVFNKNGLIQINPSPGDKFNPHIHEALFSSPIPEQAQEKSQTLNDDQSKDPVDKTKSHKYSPGTISVVTKIGYQLKDRTIRPALVGVYN